MDEKKKYVIQAAGSSPFRRPPKPNRPILNPETKAPAFGHIPDLTTPGKRFPAGPICLREGKHRGPHKGFGFEHIWREHFAQETDPSVAEQTVIEFVVKILIPGATIHYEGGLGKQSNRVAVCRRMHGIIILEEILDSTNSVNYSIVTAIPGGKPYGPVIGALGRASSVIGVSQEIDQEASKSAEVPSE